MRVIGIDPGLDGAVAVITASDWKDVYDTPTAVVEGKKKRRIYVPSEMAATIQRLYGHAPGAKGDVVVILERVHAMPGQGVRSMFSMGQGLGLWEGILAALYLRYEFVTPQRWKREMMDGMGKDKDASRIRAMQLFPDMAESLKLVKHHGRADALLLAEYGRRTWTAQ